MVNIAVLVSGGGSNLQALMDSQKKGPLKSGQIRLVIADRANCYAIERAKNNGIKTLELDRKSKGFQRQLLLSLKENDIALVVLAGFLSIVGEDIINSYNRRIINIHPSLIPAFCGDGCYGLKVHEMALKKGVKISGATVHIVDKGVDTGEILMQKAVKVKKNDSPESLQRRIMEKAEWILLPKAAEYMCRQIIKEKKDVRG